MGVKIIRDETLRGIADAIRSKTGLSDPIKPTDMASAIGDIAVGGGGEDRYDEGYEDGYNNGLVDGKTSVFKAQDHATQLHLYSLNGFGASKAELTLPRVTTLASFCSPGGNTATPERINTTVEELTINCLKNKITSMSAALGPNNVHPDQKLKKLTLNIDTSACTNFTEAFQNLRALEIIDGEPLDLSSVTNPNYTNKMFSGCKELKEVRFEEKSLKVNLAIPSSSSLSKTSIVSLLEALSPDVTGKTITFNEDAVKDAFETSPGAKDGVSSAEWQQWTSGDNWTINPAWTVALL